MNMQLKVSTEVLRSEADQMTDHIDVIRTQWDNIRTIGNNTTGYWEGHTENKHLKLIKKTEDDMDELLRRLTEHPADILKMAGIYEEAEESSVEVANILPADVIL